MYNSFRPYLFRLDPERAHELTLNALSRAGRFFVTRKLLDYYESTSKVEKDKIEGTRKFMESSK